MACLMGTRRNPALRLLVGTHRYVCYFRRYKAAGANATDASGVKDTVEFINISQDDVLAYPQFVHRTYPSTVNARMQSTIIPFVTKSVAVNETVLSIFNAKLGLPQGTLAQLHRLDVPSNSEARCIKNPPKPELQPAADPKVAIGAHTDFGSLVSSHYHLEGLKLTCDRQSFLHNRLGGLQVLPPGYTEWQYVKVRIRFAR